MTDHAAKCREAIEKYDRDVDNIANVLRKMAIKYPFHTSIDAERELRHAAGDLLEVMKLHLRSVLDELDGLRKAPPK